MLVSMVWIGRLGDQRHAHRRRQVVDLVGLGHQLGAPAPRRPPCPWYSGAGDGLRTAARFSIVPVDSSSTTDTRSPRAKSASTRWLPMNPAPPVTRQCFITSTGDRSHF